MIDSFSSRWTNACSDREVRKRWASSVRPGEAREVPLQATMAVGALCWCALCLPGSAWAERSELHLRVAWGGGTARQWTGTLSLGEGSFSDLRYLGLEADQAATVYLNGGAIEIRHGSVRDYDGLDVRVTATRSAVLTVEMSPKDHSEEMLRVEVPLTDVISGYYHSVLDSQNNQLLIQRVPGDSLHVVWDRDALVFAPGERLEFRVVPHLLGLEEGTAVRCHVQLVPARSERPLWETNVEFAAPGAVWGDGATTSLAPMAITVPDGDGAYELVVSLYPAESVCVTHSCGPNRSCNVRCNSWWSGRRCARWSVARGN